MLFLAWGGKLIFESLRAQLLDIYELFGIIRFHEDEIALKYVLISEKFGVYDVCKRDCIKVSYLILSTANFLMVVSCGVLCCLRVDT